jgi:hypothetical protein
MNHKMEMDSEGKHLQDCSCQFDHFGSMYFLSDFECRYGAA